MKRYPDPTALRRSLETRLKTRSEQCGLPLDRLRKEAALQRLLARIAATAPDGSWALKGGLAMLARIGHRARVTADADATWRTAASQLHEMLEDAAEAELADHFEFLIGTGRPIQAEGPEGGLRFPVRCLLAGRTFETLRLDVNVVPADPRPLDHVELRNLFDFTDLPPVVVPAVRVEQQLAEKIHAYTRDYGDQDNSRAKDLFDMIALAQHLRLPNLAELHQACRKTFALRNTTWPPTLQPPPALWDEPWQGFVRDYAMPYTSLESAYTALNRFWAPLLDTHPQQDDQSQWDPNIWTWQ